MIPRIGPSDKRGVSGVSRKGQLFYLQRIRRGKQALDISRPGEILVADSRADFEEGGAR
jgi:hypothetical protein